MPWNPPIPMMMGGQARYSVFVTVATNQQLYNLFTAAGEPEGPVDVFLTVNSGVNIDTMTIAGFESSSIVHATFNGTGRGTGGAGGTGGYAEGGTGGPIAGPGLAGFSGGTAITVDGIELRINMDSGNVWGGGGGGGGGGGACSLAAVAAAGGGGGGGQGWNTSAGGSVGTQATGENDGTDGANGGPAGAGTGGDGSTPAGNASGGWGGNGGAWGTAGSTGGTGTSDAVGFAQGSLGGGAAGRAIRAINGATVSLTGAKSAATLESEGRLLGGILVE